MVNTFLHLIFIMSHRLQTFLMPIKFYINPIKGLFYCVVIIRSPVNQSVCAGETVNFTCVVMFTSVSPDPASWFTNNGISDASRKSGHSLTDDINGRSAPANVTNVLTVTNPSINNNGGDYTCAQGVIEESDTVFLTVFGELTVHLCVYVTVCTYVHTV